MRQAGARGKIRAAFLMICILILTPNIFSQTKIAEGFIEISPLTVTAGSEHVSVFLIYTAGKTAWGNGEESGVLRVIVPVGWSAPSLNPSDPGYFTV